MTNMPDDSDMDRELGATFSGSVAPDVGIDFHQRLRLRLQAEHVDRSLSLPTLALRLYWAMVVLGSFVILRLLPWDAEFVRGPFAMALVILGCLFLIPSLLVRRLGWIELLLDCLGDRRRL